MVSWNPWSSEAGNLFAAFTENGIDISGLDSGSSSSSRSTSSNDLASILSNIPNWNSFSDLSKAEAQKGSALATTAYSATDSPFFSHTDIGSLFCSFRDQYSDLFLTQDKNTIINNNNNASQPNFQLPIGSTLPKAPLLASEPPKAPADHGLPKAAPESPNGKANSTAQYTEQVQVRSSAHVSYIVGKQGTKIRQIRTETETHIKTPVNGEDPVFEISGRRQNVEKAKERILEEEIAYSNSLFERACNYREGDRRMLNLYLPSRFIGLVVGKKGSSIKRIMELSSTTIVTPKVNTINIFEIYGTQRQIQRAVDLIKKHITSNNDVAITEQANAYEVTLNISPK